MRPMSRRRGLTLIELIVVLTILVAVAGLIVPTFPNLLSRTGYATSAASVSDVDNLMSQYFASNMNYPDQFDALIDSDKNLYSKLPPAAATSLPISTPLTTGEAASLSRVGITTVHVMRPAPADPEDDFDATFDATLPVDNPGYLVTVAEGMVVVRLDPTAAAEEMRLSTTGNYVVFGFGDRSTAIGPNILRPPVSFGSHRPPEVYQRILVVFEVFEDGSPARYVGSLSIDNDGDDHLVGYSKQITGFRKHPEDH